MRLRFKQNFNILQPSKQVVRQLLQQNGAHFASQNQDAQRQNKNTVHPRHFITLAYKLLDNCYNKMEHTSHPKTKMRKEKIKTLCTLDTFDFSHHDAHNNKENRSKNGPSFLTQTKSTVHKRKETKRSGSHNKSQFSVFANSRMKETTPKTRPKRMMSIAYNNNATRMKTDYSENEQPVAFKRIVSELKKKLVFPIEDNYKFQAFKILRAIHQTQLEHYCTVKVGSTYPKKYTLIRTKLNEIAHYYELQSACYSEIAERLCSDERKQLLRVHRIWKQRKEWLITMDNYINPSWTDDKFYLFLNQFKNSNDSLRPLIRQIAQAILTFSNAGRAHNNISLNNIYFPVVKGEIKAEGTIKLGGLAKNISSKCKAGYLNMPLLFRTPPEIMNLILFEEQQPFDRDYLEQISELKEGWQTDVWSLGILLLELLNGGPLAGEGSDCSQLLLLQRELLIRYSYLLDKLDAPLQICLHNMLSFNPAARPHPRHIMQLL